MEPIQDPFYIGYLEKMPKAYKKNIRGFVLLAGLLFLLGAGFFLAGQKPFSTSTFELGQSSQVRGYLVDTPVPLLLLDQGKAPDGKPVIQSILLIGFGKHGAEATLAEAAALKRQDLYNKWITLEGTLIYYDGITLLELTKGKASVLTVEEGTAPRRTVREGQHTNLLGEIVDPKCFFGVMKPGEGKAHRSCASLCIAGGIPPVLKTTAANGQHQYLIVQGPEGKLLPSTILPYIGQAVKLSGRQLKYDDWQLLRIADPAAIEQLSSRLLLDAPMCTYPGITSIK